MGINISQFNPPGTVSNLVWDDDMKPGAGKIFKGDLTGNVTGNVTGDMVGNITNGGVNGYLLRSGVVSASSGVLIVPAGSSAGNTPVTITLNGNGTYCIKNDTQKCYYPSPCTIPVSLSSPPYGFSYENNAYARSYDADNVLIDGVSNAGNLNIYGASYIILKGGTAWSSEEGYSVDVAMNVANAYIDAGTTVIPGMVAPPTNGVFTGDVVGKIIVNGCKWSNTEPYLAYTSVNIFKGIEAKRTDTTLSGANQDINYPYFGAIQFEPKTGAVLPATITVTGNTLGELGRVKTYGSNGVLNIYEQNSIGTTVFNLDLTDVLYIRAEGIGSSDHPTTITVPPIYVIPPGYQHGI